MGRMGGHDRGSGVSQRDVDRWLQAGLQRLVAPDLGVDGAAGPRTRAAIKEFQRRVHEFVPAAPKLAVDGVAGPATIAALEAATGTRRPGHDPAPAPTAALVDEGDEQAAEADADEPAAPAAAVATPVAGGRDSYAERRVRVRIYGKLPASSPLLVAVPAAGAGPRRLHRLAAEALAVMSRAVQRDLGLELKLASAWRPHRWQSREQYEAVLVQRFGSVAEGKRWLAFDSPHETGLAIDIGVGGLTPSRASVAFQREQPLHRWLVAHAYEFGFHPYKTEPWHWEFPMSLEAHRTGVVGPGDLGPPDDDLSFGTDDEDALEDIDLEEDPGEPLTQD